MQAAGSELLFGETKGFVVGHAGGLQFVDALMQVERRLAVALVPDALVSRFQLSSSAANCFLLAVVSE